MKSKPEKGNAPGCRSPEASNVKTQTITAGSNMSNSTAVTTNAAIATPDLALVEGQITTTSLQIADHFGKAHNLVLRTIRNLECSREFNQCNFAPVEYLDAKGEKRPSYRITRDGFVFLAMGFTGKEAAQWKEAYITAFNKMEAELRGKVEATNPAIDYTRISPAQKQDFREIVQAIVEAGIQKHGETWARFQRKFRINSYEELSASRYEEARQYLIAKLPNGYVGEVMEPVAQITMEQIEHAMAGANALATQVQQAALKEMLSAGGAKYTRWAVSFDYSETGPKPHVSRIEDEALVGTLPQMAKLIQDPGAALGSAELMDLARACMNRLASRIGTSRQHALV